VDARTLAELAGHAECVKVLDGASKAAASIRM